MSNAATIDALTPTTDLYGRTIAIGSLVRSFGTPILTKDDRLIGLNSVPNEADGNRLNFVDGIVVAIGEVFLDCPRYTIRVIREVCTREYGKPPVIEMAEPVGDAQQLDPDRATINPPVNGTRSWGGTRTFGVVVL